MPPTADELANTPGRLRLGDVVLSVAALSARAEQALTRELQGIVADGTDVWRRVEPHLAYLEAAKRFNDRAQLVELVGRSIRAGATADEDAALAARSTNPTVPAREVYRRARPFHPNLELRELEAVITPTNVADVCADLEQALGAAADAKKAPAGSP